MTVPTRWHPVMTPSAVSAQLPLPRTFTSPGLTCSTHPVFAQKTESYSSTLIPKRSEGGVGPAHCDAPDQPRVHFVVQPSHCAHPDLDTLRKPKIGLQLVDHRAAQARNLADLGQPQDLKRAFSRGGCDHGETPVI